jgi:hypothetical protein
MEISSHRERVSVLSPRGGTNKPSFASENRMSEDEDAEIYNALPAKVISTGNLSSSSIGYKNHFMDSHKVSEDLGTTYQDISTPIYRSVTPKRRYSISAESGCCGVKKNSPCPECNIF